MITGTARKVYTMKTDAPDAKALVHFVNSYAAGRGYNGGIGLDSLDTGDALGYLMELLDAEDSVMGDMILVAPEGFTITISSGWELFTWTGTDGMQTAFNPDEI